MLMADGNSASTCPPRLLEQGFYMANGEAPYFIICHPLTTDLLTDFHQHHLHHFPHPPRQFPPIAPRRPYRRQHQHPDLQR